jgi:hypothetical protein
VIQVILSWQRNAEAALFLPEKAKYTRTSERVTHLSPFALLEVGLTGGVVGVRGTFDFNVSLDGCATGMVQPNLTGLPLVITRFAEEGRTAIYLYLPTVVRASSASLQEYMLSGSGVPLPGHL